MDIARTIMRTHMTIEQNHMHDEMEYFSCVLSANIQSSHVCTILSHLQYNQNPVDTTICDREWNQFSDEKKK